MAVEDSANARKEAQGPFIVLGKAEKSASSPYKDKRKEGTNDESFQDERNPRRHSRHAHSL